MPLPSLEGEFTEHTIRFGDITVIFRLRFISGPRMLEINRAGDEAAKLRGGEEAKAIVNDVAIPILAAGIGSWYDSNANPNPEDWTDEYAKEVWTEWPVWARSELFDAVHAYSTIGPAADPKAPSPSTD